MLRGIALFLLSVWAQAVSAGPLHIAASEGDLALVRSLLAQGADIDAPGANGETPLILAVLDGHEEVASLLIDQGADIRTRNEGGFTPLHAAAYANAVEMARLILARGAEIDDQQNKAGVTPLSIAAEEGWVPMVRFLIENGADLEAGERNGYTPLARAIWRGNNEIVSLLQAAGAKCQSADVMGEPAHTECMAGQL